MNFIEYLKILSLVLIPNVMGVGLLAVLLITFTYFDSRRLLWLGIVLDLIIFILGLYGIVCVTLFLW